MADDGVWRRGGGGSGPRRGGRGRGGGDRRGHRRRGGSHPLSREDDDGDYSMDNTRDNNRYKPYNRRAHMDNPDDDLDGGNSKRPSVFSRIGGGKSAGGGGASGGGGGGRPSHGRTSWHKVTIIRGGSQSREWLMRTLKESISEPFMAVQTHQLGDKVMFYVEDHRAAQQLRALDTIQSKDGQLKVLVKPSPPPRGGPDRGTGGGGGGGSGGGGGGARGPGGGRRGARSPQGQQFVGRRDSDEDMAEGEDVLMGGEGVAEIIQAVLATRYQVDTQALDLSNMFNDQKFREHKIRASMYDRKFVDSVLSIIGEHCPELQELNLSNNRLQHLSAYVQLPVRCAKLTTLDLSCNEIRDVGELDHIKDMGTVAHLRLADNPVSRNSQDFGSLCSAVRKCFPNLQSLDGQSLPSPVKFDLPVASTSLPSYVKNHILSEEAKQLVVQFIEQYYSIYDGQSREKLLEAYGGEAVFSLCVIMPVNHRDNQLQKYISKSRNLAKVLDEGKRQSLLKHGRIDIVQMLRDLPATKHYTDLMEVDIIRASGSEVYFKLYGVFSEEGDHKEVLVRSFTRSFILFLNGGSVLIMNDMLSITSASFKTTQHVHDLVRSSPFSA